TEAPVSKSTKKKEKVVSETPTPEVEIDLTAFNAAVQSAMEQADASTGEVAPEVIGEVNKVYRTLDGAKPKNAARATLDVAMKAALEGDGEYADMDKMERFLKARGYVSIRDGLTAGGSSTPKAP